MSLVNLKPEDLESLKQAVDLLQNPNFAMRLTNYLGMPIEKAFELLPKKYAQAVNKITSAAIKKALQVALLSMNQKVSDSSSSSDTMHKMLSGLSGAIGGALGLSALAVELPLSTTIILRSIADIARSEKEDIRSLDTQLACLEVFALSGKEKSDDSVDTGYYALRAALAQAVSEAAEYIATRGIIDETAPALLRLISQLSARYGITVSEKAAAQAIPLIGAIGGATVNLMFIDHFQNIARGHFIVRRLESVYGIDTIKNEYTRIAKGC